MQSRPVKIPGADHPITIDPVDGPVSVRIGGEEIARSESALSLSEKGYSIVYYFPRDDVAIDRLKRGAKQTYCPYKGDATHFDIDIDADVFENAAWSYEDPFYAMRRIEGHIAFYQDLPDIEIRIG
jgi:uncharacterized protein (DUF427 family)